MGTRKYLLGLMWLLVFGLSARAIFLDSMATLQITKDTWMAEWPLSLAIPFALTVGGFVVMFVMVTELPDTKIGWKLATLAVAAGVYTVGFFATANTTITLGVMLAGCFLLRQIGDLPKSELEILRKPAPEKVASATVTHTRENISN